MSIPHRRRAVFLDRDGVINHLVHREELGFHAAPPGPDRVHLIPGAGGAIARLKRAGFLVLVVTNQPGIAKGDFSPSDLEAVHQRMVLELAAEGGTPDGFYHCPHAPPPRDASPTTMGGTPPVSPLLVDCRCRKPRPGMIETAAAEHGVDLGSSWMVGDNATDVIAGRRAGCGTVAVFSAHWEDPPLTPTRREGRGFGSEESHPDVRVLDLPAAVDWILESIP